MEQADTEKMGYWERFLQTGSVADYLSYTASSLGEHAPEQKDAKDCAEDRKDAG